MADGLLEYTGNLQHISRRSSQGGEEGLLPGWVTVGYCHPLLLQQATTDGDQPRPGNLKVGA